MPPSMSAEVSTYIYGAFLRTIPLFRGLGNEIIFRLCLVVKPMLALKLQVRIAYTPPAPYPTPPAADDLHHDHTT